ncbi:FANCD2 opposite strand protein [Microtus ochrogaster]|uniref:FANCD2 opposite strand protein n=1 Tax=Microtus ochrogaster TaxID=79684 RepID=A0A8J6L2M5_MICOH|nr:FANCD2 opposite strand protein [Microtus ochrogaster]
MDVSTMSFYLVFTVAVKSKKDLHIAKVQHVTFQLLLLWSFQLLGQPEKTFCGKLNPKSRRVVHSGSPRSPGRTSGHETTIKKKVLIKRPKPVCLVGVDSVFGRSITVQPSKWTGTFRVSDTSAFSKVVSKEQQWPTGLKEPQIEMAVAMCKQMLRSILLLYAIYKKCTFALQHSQ